MKIDNEMLFSEDMIRGVRERDRTTIEIYWNTDNDEGKKKEKRKWEK